VLRLTHLLTALVAALTLLGAVPPWISKPVPAWTPDDARLLLTDSPWAKTVNAAVAPLETEDQRREGGQMGQEHGLGYDGLADDRPRIQPLHGVLDIVKPEAPAPQPSQSIALQLRWESALPIRVAELKSGPGNIPAFAGQGYLLAVYGIPRVRAYLAPDSLTELLRKQAFLRREGQADVKPSSVEVIQSDDGIVVLYRFPLSAEVSVHDRRIEFNARIGRITISQSFKLEEMLFQGKLEL
jgi:hypothetical protein